MFFFHFRIIVILKNETYSKIELFGNTLGPQIFLLRHLELGIFVLLLVKPRGRINSKNGQIFGPAGGSESVRFGLEMVWKRLRNSLETVWK